VLLFFEDHTLDIDRRELRRGLKRIAIEPQVFDLLVYLVQNRDRVVSKDDLIRAVWNGRIVSDSALSSRITAVRHAIGDSGEQQRLIRTIPRKGFRFVGEASEAQSSGHGGPAKTALPIEDPKAMPALALALPNKPSIAVLPFQNIGGDAEQEYFADGVVEEIITGLSRVRWLFVIARNSSFTYKGRTVDVRQVGRELGVRYVLQGSVRKSANQVRITGQLIDASSGGHLWADRFNGMLDDIFDLQDKVTARVVGTIAPRLEQAEIERAKRKPTDILDAYDLFLRGLAGVHQATNETNSEAMRYFCRAIELDSEFASAYGMAAYCYVWRKTNGWMTDRAQEITEAARLVRRTVELGKDDAVALARGGHALAYVVGDLDDGAAWIDQALVLNPNLALAWYASGWVRVYLGEPDIAIEHLAQAMRLSPVDPETGRMQAGIATAHLLSGRYDEASSWAQKALREQPSYLTTIRLVAASSALAGRLDEAREAMERLRRIDPALHISNLKDRLPLRRPEDFGRYTEGLRKAGLPE
jgi:TolB-like protein